jgi:hypothetical protein
LWFPSFAIPCHSLSLSLATRVGVPVVSVCILCDVFPEGDATQDAMSFKVGLLLCRAGGCDPGGAQGCPEGSGWRHHQQVGQGYEFVLGLQVLVEQGPVSPRPQVLTVCVCSL